jgi:hypothetical protein
MRTLLASTAFAALVIAAPSVALAQGTGAFCLKAVGGGNATTNCAYQTMAQCEKAKTGKSDVCSPRSATTGEGPQTPPKNGAMAPKGGMSR